jgi:hypothetical protein
MVTIANKLVPTIFLALYWTLLDIKRTSLFSREQTIMFGKSGYMSGITNWSCHMAAVIGDFRLMLCSGEGKGHWAEMAKHGFMEWKSFGGCYRVQVDESWKEYTWFPKMLSFRIFFSLLPDFLSSPFSTLPNVSFILSKHICGLLLMCKVSC